jgi:uncharacterized iron-regulated membrane protein
VWRRPQGLWARRALFQIHLWSGIGTGIYMAVISLTGSLLVFRIELHRMFTRPPVTVAIVGERLTEDQLKAAAIRAYPEHTIQNVWQSKVPEQAVEIWLNGDDGGKALHRIFDPYSGKDLGPPDPAMIRFLIWSTSLHDDLLNGDEGRKVNGAGAIFLTILCATGLVIWWPGVANWRRSLTVDLKSNWKLFNWNLHSAAGFWSFVLVLMWAISGVYLAFPTPFQDVIDYFEPLDEANPQQARIGDEFLRWITRLHFGRFGGWPTKALWTALGILPFLLFVTGAVMWWNRVLGPGLDRLKDSSRELKGVPALERVETGP